MRTILDRIRCVQGSIGALEELLCDPTLSIVLRRDVREFMGTLRIALAELWREYDAQCEAKT